MKTWHAFALAVVLAALAGCNDDAAAPPAQSNAVAPPTNAPPPPPPPSNSDSAPSPSSIATAPSEADVPTWQPDQSVLDQLGEEIDFEGYAIRIPKTFKEISVDPLTNSNSARKGWKGQTGDGSTWQILEIHVVTLSAGELPSTPADLPFTLPQKLEGFLNSSKQYYENWQNKPVEMGRVNKMLFCRAECQGFEKDLKFNSSLVYYMTIDEKKVAVIIVWGNDTNVNGSLGNASALTFHKK